MGREIKGLLIKDNHPGYPSHVVRRAARWAAKQIGMEAKVLRTLTVEVGYRRCRMGLGWGGWYKHSQRLIQVLLPRDRDHDDWPTSMAHNSEEKLAGRDAHDEWELFVAILAHELEHARCYAIARDYTERKRLNSEPRVRAVDWRALLAFREARETLLADWLREKPQRPAKPKPSIVDRRAERAAKLLSQWERRLKMAKTKVGKYRRKVNYYGAVAARRLG
jgi:hypothetical protein